MYREVFILFDRFKYEHHEVVAKLVDPFLREIAKLEGSLDDHRSLRVINDQLSAFNIICDPKYALAVKRFAEDKKFKLEELNVNNYFLRSLG